LKRTLCIVALITTAAGQTPEPSCCHKENGQDECGVFEFVMLWKQTADTWKISRVVSYGH
jgi:hypothetical protein